MAITFHADDFGITVEQSKRILAASAATRGTGILNSLSVLTTSPNFRACSELLDPYVSRLKIGLHLNLVEGPCAAPVAELPMLVDERGMFKLSFAQLMRASSGATAEEFAVEASREITAQLKRFVLRFPMMADALRIDSHQHTHMIPGVFQALVDVIDEQGYTLEYLRMPVEPIRPFLKPSILGSIKPINWPKHWLLNSFKSADMAILPEFDDVSALFCGILFSGHMDAERVSTVSRRYIDMAYAQGRDMEFLFHPGRVASTAECLDPMSAGFVDFTCSPDRDVEYDALKSLEFTPDRDALRVSAFATQRTKS